MSVHSGQYTHHSPPGSSHRCHEIEDGYRHLQAHVSPRAFAADQEGDAPKCHPNTRLAVLNDIMSWILVALSDRLTWFMWLFGAAGAGKSAIARSIVEMCLQQDIIVARFFFFRADNTRNTLDHLVPSLAYQLIRQLPELEPIISAQVRSHPLVFNDSLETQLSMLIFDPLEQLNHRSPITQSIVLLLDGVDELLGEKNHTALIQVLHKFIASKSIPVVALFASRPELNIRSEFQSQKILKITTNLALDHNYLPDNDIRQYLIDSFAEIKEKHAFKRFLSDTWPDVTVIEKLVGKSSGQFIFASLVIAFISAARSNPATQLDIIRGIRPVSGPHAPFAQLDALYCFIFSQVADIDRVILILATFILQSTTLSLKDCAELHDWTVEDIEVALADLPSIVQCRDGEIVFLHASLTDFLLDQSRSGPYFINQREWCTRLSLVFLTRKVTPHSWMITDFIAGAEPTPALRQAVINAHHPLESFDPLYNPRYYLLELQKLDFDDAGETYRHKVDQFISISLLRHPHGLEQICDYNVASNHYIRQFLDAGFADIVKKHTFRWLLPERWPADDVVNEIVTNASGQFLYAYVAIKEISNPRSNPALILENIRLVKPIQGVYLGYCMDPVDTLYRYLLSQVFDLDLTLYILAAYYLDIKTSRKHSISSAMAELTSVISFDQHQIKWPRYSFRDFIRDRHRSLQYHMDLNIWGNRFAMVQLKEGSWTGLADVTRCLNYAFPTTELREAILDENFGLDVDNPFSVDGLISYLNALRNKDFNDAGELYQTKLDQHTRWLYANHPEDLPYLGTKHEITNILQSIEKEAPEVHSPTWGPAESDSDYVSAESDLEDE